MAITLQHLRNSVGTMVRSARPLVTSAPQLGDMFCMQCEQTEQGTGCTTVGVCGKTPETAGLQDVLVENIKGLGMYTHLAREAGVPEDQEVNRFTLAGLFATMTNVNFDAHRFATDYIPKSNELKDRMKNAYVEACKAKGVEPENLEGTPAAFQPVGSNEAELLRYSQEAGVLERRAAHGNVLSGMQELITYGLKGTAAYAHHAKCLGYESPTIYSEVQRALYTLGNQTPDLDTLVQATLDVGKANLEVLALLDEAHRTKFGEPVPTPVNVEPQAGKCILVSGHDLGDLYQLLEQTAGKGINVYTHGEMLPAHSYPELKKFPHLVGNYGGPWQLQKFEFAKFPGPIVVTTNCIIEPRKSYKERIYTANVVGWPDVKHIETADDGTKDFSAMIEQALSMEGFPESTPASDKTITVGFGHNTVLSIADQVIEAVKSGNIKRFFLIGGCDGSEGERNYYKELALKTPEDSVILTLGCGKYRFNKLDFGVVPGTGIPRLLDMGQCNDSYGAVVVANALADAFGTDLNGLPLSFAVSWFEQKAVAVLLTMLHLNIKDIALGPNLPAFVSPEVASFLTDTFGLRGADVANVDADLEKYMSS